MKPVFLKTQITTLSLQLRETLSNVFYSKAKICETNGKETQNIKKIENNDFH